MAKEDADGDYEPRSRATRNCHVAAGTTDIDSLPEETQASDIPLLKQLQYRSYVYPIHIYHFRGTKQEVTRFRDSVSREEHGLLETRLGEDQTYSQPRPEGDEIPKDCIEIAYLPNVFHKTGKGLAGSALGFSVGGYRVEWMCFDRPVEATILATWARIRNRNVFKQCPFGPVTNPVDNEKLFDHVAELPKGIARGVLGANMEHKLWHASLLSAEPRPSKFKLTWNNKANARQQAAEEVQRRYAAENAEYSLHGASAKCNATGGEIKYDIIDDVESGYSGSESEFDEMEDVVYQSLFTGADDSGVHFDSEADMDQGEQERTPQLLDNTLRQSHGCIFQQLIQNGPELNLGFKRQPLKGILKFPAPSHLATGGKSQRRISFPDIDSLEQVRTFVPDDMVTDENMDPYSALEKSTNLKY